MVEQSSPEDYFSRVAYSSGVVQNQFPVQDVMGASIGTRASLVDATYEPDVYFKYVVVGVVAIVAIVAIVYWYERK